MQGSLPVERHVINERKPLQTARHRNGTFPPTPIRCQQQGVCFLVLDVGIGQQRVGRRSAAVRMALVRMRDHDASVAFVI
jgi:hypothetical protein